MNIDLSTLDPNQPIPVPEGNVHHVWGATCALLQPFAQALSMPLWTLFIGPSEPTRSVDNLLLLRHGPDPVDPVPEAVYEAYRYAVAWAVEASLLINNGELRRGDLELIARKIIEVLGEQAKLPDTHVPYMGGALRREVFEQAVVEMLPPHLRY